MKQSIYLLLALLTPIPNTATKSVTNSLIIASTLVLSPTNSQQIFSKRRSLNLHKAIEQRDYASVQNLINNPKADVNAKVDYYIDVDKNYKIYGNTPLIMCCNQGDNTSLQIAKALLEHDNINVNLGNKRGETPLIKCCISGDNTSLQIAKALLEHGNINVNLGDKYGDTPLDTIIFFITENKVNYTYVNLWNILVAKRGILNKRKKEYANLNPSHFEEPERTYIHLIKQNPPKNCTNNKFIDHQEETKTMNSLPLPCKNLVGVGLVHNAKPAPTIFPCLSFSYPPITTYVFALSDGFRPKR